MRSIFQFVLLGGLIMPMTAHASTVTISLSNGGALSQISVGDTDAPKDVAWKYLGASKGIRSRKDLRTASIQTLKDAGKLPYQRVEVDGVSATDNTSLQIPGMFDKQLKMSYMNEPAAPGGIRQFFRDAFNWGSDVLSAAHDMDGKLTPHAEEVLSPIKGKQIPELIAHSWGTEAVYAAILSGYIPPPKKLILVGIPEENYAQWYFLAKYTGIEVHVLGFKADKVQATGNIMDKFVTGLPRDSVKLEALWRRRCAEMSYCVDTSKGRAIKLDYDVNIVRPHEEALWPAEPFNLHSHAYSLPGMDHDRIDYFKVLAKRGLLNKTIAQLDRFDASQRTLIKDDEDETFRGAMGEASLYISQAKALAAEEAAREAQLKQEQEARDASIRTTLLNMARDVCKGDDSIKQEDLDALPAASSNLDCSRSPDLVGNNCGSGIFMEACLGVLEGDKLNLEVFKESMLVNPPIAAPPPDETNPEYLRAAIQAGIALRVRTKNLEADAQAMRDIATSACNPAGLLLPREDGQTFSTAYHALLNNGGTATADGGVAGYSPDIALTGLSGCALDVMVEFLKYPDNDLNNNARDVLERYHPRPVVVRPDPRPDPRPNPEPRPQPRHCAASQGGVCVWWSD